MGRKYNTRHNRSKSHYPERLAARGMSSRSAHMLDLETLRRRQQGNYEPIKSFEIPWVKYPQRHRSS